MLNRCFLRKLFVVVPVFLISCLMCGCQSYHTLTECGVQLFEKKRFNTAIRCFNIELNANPLNVNAYVGRGNAWAEEKKVEKAFCDYNRAIEIDPSSASAYYARAYLWNEIGNTNNALADYTRAINVNTNFLSAYVNRAVIFEQVGLTNSAICDYTLLLSLAPNDAKALFARGCLFFSTGRYSEAVNDYSKAISITPSDPNVYSGRADAWYKLKEHQKAILDYEKAVKYKSSNPAPYNNLAWLLATSPDDKLRNRKKAKSLAKKALRIVTHLKYSHLMPSVYSTLAAVYADDGDFESAILYQNKAIECSRNVGESVDGHDFDSNLMLYLRRMPVRQL